ncbi:MAG: C25 family cysteine peptidase [Candidatus Cloacimonadota bacterium]|nr:C25 family cysteine peptidase [Candidatus Cloacimonadota bacterium]
MKSKNIIRIISTIILFSIINFTCLFATPKNDLENGLREELSKIFDSPEEIEQFIEHTERFKPTIKKEDCTESISRGPQPGIPILLPYTMIIITNDDLEQDFLEFAKIKNAEGIKTKVVTISLVGNTPEEIRDYLKTQKMLNPFLKYVLIGGDASVVMPKIIDTGMRTDYSSFPTDYYFCNVLSDWISDDEINFEADLYVGRIPANTGQEVQNFIDKYISYRQVGNYSNKYHLIANNIHRMPGNTRGNDIIDSIAQHIDTDIDFTYEEDLASAFSPAGVLLGNAMNSDDHNFLFNVTHGGDRTITAHNINSNWNAIGGLADYPNSQEITNVYEWSVNGHWNDTTGYYYEYLPDYLTNSNPYVLWNSSCASTKFVNSNNDPQDCIGACFLTDNNGAVAYYGSAHYEFPFIGRFAAEYFMDFIFLNNISKIGLNTINSLQFIYHHAQNISILKNYIIAHILFGDPSMEIWSCQAEKLVTICKGGNTFKSMDSSGNAVEATIVVLDEDKNILGRGISPYTFAGILYDDYIITSNSPNYLQSMNEYYKIKEYSGLPYEMSFENGIDNNWEMFNSNEYGNILVTSDHRPHSDVKHLIMDANNPEVHSLNEAWLHLNLENQEEIEISFWWKEFNDDVHFEDGVYISDNGGERFEKIYTLRDNNNRWESVIIPLDEIVRELRMRYTNDFVIKFQQYDNEKIPNDGFAFDDINVYSNLRDLKNKQIVCNAVISFENNPNPFNSINEISFSLPTPSIIDISVYNILGNKVKNLVLDEFGKGLHHVIWDGTDQHSRRVGAGVYFYKFNVNGSVKQIKKCLLIR